MVALRRHVRTWARTAALLWLIGPVVPVALCASFAVPSGVDCNHHAAMGVRASHASHPHEKSLDYAPGAGSAAHGVRVALRHHAAQRFEGGEPAVSLPGELKPQRGSSQSRSRAHCCDTSLADCCVQPLHERVELVASALSVVPAAPTVLGSAVPPKSHAASQGPDAVLHERLGTRAGPPGGLYVLRI